ncbi:methyltransferase domain-containing protein [Candidatus Campbellbacteria bacterium]|nr:MAG: methyltransferase domain-containing protein [Candidatus Campbellbacteria bacterium]
MKEISGDIPLSWDAKIWYLAYNTVRNLCELRYPLRMLFWHATFSDETSDSPMRSYLDAFMRTELPRLVPPHPLSVFDIGCGTAYMRSVLVQGGYSGFYTGVDVVREPRFDAHAYPEFQTTFLNQDVTACSTEKKFDLVISNTSLEHVVNDTAVVGIARAVTAKGGIEVHIVPSLWSLPLYLWHGYRQYTPARIRRLFKGTRYMTYRMGGLASFFLHLFSITLLERIFGYYGFRKKPMYVHLKKIARRGDAFLPWCSVLYAVIVFHE